MLNNQYKKIKTKILKSVKKHPFLSISSVIFFLLLWLVLFFPLALKEDKKITIPNNATAKTVAEILANNHIIYNKEVFLLFVKVFNMDKKIIPGEFLIKEDANMVSLIFYITNSKNLFQYRITFVEGLTVKEIMAIINSTSNLKGKISTIPKEGTLMPDTYFFLNNATKDEIIQTMASSMESYLNELWQNRDKSLPYKNMQEALILASLVEKEATHFDERELIAGVFLNRLKIGMKLQTDPSVAYGLGKKNADKLTKKDLQANHPYNTYIIYGLPPSPIANPSRRSLQAVFNPAKTQYLYFVANGEGGHVFAKTLKEHNANVIKWRSIEKQIRIKEASK